MTFLGSSDSTSWFFYKHTVSKVGSVLNSYILHISKKRMQQIKRSLTMLELHLNTVPDNGMKHLLAYALTKY